MNINEHDLQELAYRIWEAEGRPFGQAERHWQMALEQAHMGKADFAPHGGERHSADSSTQPLQDERQYALQNNPLDETTQTAMEAEGMNTPEQPLVSSQPSEKIGGKRKAKAKSAETLANQDLSGGGNNGKSRKGKSSNNNILV